MIRELAWVADSSRLKLKECDPKGQVTVSQWASPWPIAKTHTIRFLPHIGSAVALTRSTLSSCYMGFKRTYISMVFRLGLCHKSSKGPFSELTLPLLLFSALLITLQDGSSLA